MLANVITADMCKGVLDEMVGLLPILIPVTVSFIAIRKGLGFFTSTLHAA